MPAPPPPTTMQSQMESSNIDDFDLPRSIVARLIKAALPENVKLQRDAQLAIQKSATVFVNYITSTAHDLTNVRGKKMISPADILAALEIIEFPEFVSPLKNELEIYQKVQMTKKTLSKSRGAKPQEKKKTSKDEVRKIKKAKIDDGGKEGDNESDDETIEDGLEPDASALQEETMLEEEEVEEGEEEEEDNEEDEDNGNDESASASKKKEIIELDLDMDQDHDNEPQDLDAEDTEEE